MKTRGRRENETMCSTTKQKIAGTLHQMMMERPFQKITVQNLMDASGMKRQSFYYHFQDTREVLQWICDQELIQPLRESDLEFEEWLLYGLELIDRDRSFYRRVIAVPDLEFAGEMAEQMLQRRVASLFYGSKELRQLNEQQSFCVRFGAQAIASHATEFINSRQGLELNSAQANLRCLLETLGLRESERRSGSV